MHERTGHEAARARSRIGPLALVGGVVAVAGLASRLAMGVADGIADGGARGCSATSAAAACPSGDVAGACATSVVRTRAPRKRAAVPGSEDDETYDDDDEESSDHGADGVADHVDDEVTEETDDEATDDDDATDDAAAEAPVAVEPPPDPEPIADRGPLVRHVLRLVDADGNAAPGMRVSWGSTCPGRAVLTDAAGETDFRFAADDELQVRVEDRLGAQSVAVRGETTTAIVIPNPTVEVAVVDGATGAALSVVPSSVVGRDGTWIDRESAAPGLFRLGGTSSEPSVEVVFDPPAGYGALAVNVWSGPVAMRARRARLSVPAYPAERWTFRAVDSSSADRKPIAGASPTRVELSRGMDGLNVTWRCDASGDDGIVRVDGVPRIPFATSMKLGFAAGGDLDRRCGAVSFSLDAPPAQPIDVVLNGGGWYRGPAGSVSGCGAASTYEGPEAPLDVVVLHRDGAPAAGVRVVVCGDGELTGRDGRAHFAAIPTGRTFVLALAHGFLPTSVFADVGSDDAVEIVEEPARRVSVLVADDDGRPLAAARVTAEAWVSGTWRTSIAQVDGDVEDLTPRTDRFGEVVLRVPPGEVSYRVDLGFATRSIDSDDDVVRVVLREESTR